MRVITYREFSHLCVKILITVILSLCHHRIPYSIAVGTNHHLAAPNKSGSYVAPWGPIANFFRGYESSLYLQTLLLLDLWSQAIGLGGDAFSSIKSAPIIYYIQILFPQGPLLPGDLSYLGIPHTWDSSYQGIPHTWGPLLLFFSQVAFFGFFTSANMIQ